MGWLKKIANSITGNSLIGTAVGAIGSLVSGHQQQQAQERAAQLQFENWQRTYGIQRKDALADYQRQLNDQRQLMLDQAGIQKQGLINAGMNPANQAGNMTLTVPNIDNTRESSGTYNPVSQTASPMASFADYMSKMTDPLYKAQYDLVQANIDKTRTDADKGKTEGEILKNKLQEVTKTLQDRISLVAQEVTKKWQENMNLATEGNILKNKETMQSQEYENMKQQFKLLAAQTTTAEAVAEYAKEENKQKVELLKAQIANLNTQSDMNKVQKEILEIDKTFKSMGININSELGQLAAIFSKGSDSKLMQNVLSGVRAMFNELASQIPGIISDIASAVPGIAEGIASGVRKAFNSDSDADFQPKFYKWVNDVWNYGSPESRQYEAEIKKYGLKEANRRAFKRRNLN